MSKARNGSSRRFSATSRKALALAAAIYTLGVGGAHAADLSVAPPPPPADAPPLLPPPIPLAPLGVFGVDMPAAGKLTFSVGALFWNLSHSLLGTQGVSSQQLAATVPWYWSPTTSKLRLIPQNIAIASEGVSLCYGVTKDISIFVATGMIEKNLDMLTFKGASGITPLGMSFTGTDGMTDSVLAGFWRVYQDPINRIQINLGMSFPTGGTNNTFTLLQPNGTYATSRAFYSMQPGSGTFDVMPGIVYAGALERWSWGLSYRARLPLGVNPEGWMYGDLHEFTGWGGYSWTPSLTTTIRVSGSLQGPIIGADPLVVGKAPAANPTFYGGQRIELFGGATIGGKIIGVDALSMLVEAGIPVYQNLNGPLLSK
ncbi:MAG: alpha-amylase, partial [Methylocystis sp.]